MALQTSFDRGWKWRVRPFVNVSEKSRELVGEEVLSLVGGRVRKMGEEKTYTTENPSEAVSEYIRECLFARRLMGSATEIIVVEQKLRALAEFEVLKPDGSHGGFYQASIVVHQGLD